MPPDNPLNTQAIVQVLTDIVLAIRDQKANSDNYSTEEVDTGTTWVDGKTIYKKTQVGTITATAGARTTAVLTPSGLTNYIKSEGYVLEPDGVKVGVNIARFFATGLTPGGYANVMDLGNNPTLYYYATSSGTGNYVITMFYTK